MFGMSYWMTTHWPRKENESTESSRYGVWVQDNKRHLIDRVSLGDLVFIYETRSGRSVVRTYTDGSTRTFARHQGSEGIVALVEVIEAAFELDDSEEERYTDGSKAWWRYCAPTRSINSSGFIPRPEVNAILGYSENNVFRGFGEEHSGLKEIPEEVFDRLLNRFLISTEADERERMARAQYRRFGPGGEGAEHLALKERIAADPSTFLREPGLKLWNMEWLLPTGDKIDLVLKDQFDRFVAVEVEVRCDAREVAGPLQCMKYRAMLSYFFNRPLDEVRCILVAHAIHSDVCQRCEAHSIETKTVPKT
jgi:Endonuclease NucS